MLNLHEHFISYENKIITFVIIKQLYFIWCKKNTNAACRNIICNLYNRSGECYVSVKGQTRLVARNNFLLM